MLEGSRTFDIVWGSVTATICFALGAWVLFAWLRERGSGLPSMFGAAVDPQRKLMFAWGRFAMIMGGTNFGCRYIDHAYLEGVHEGFFALTLLVVGIDLPAMLRLTFVRRVRRTGATSAVACET